MLHPRNGFYEITRQFLLPDVPLQFEQLAGLHAARRDRRRRCPPHRVRRRLVGRGARSPAHARLVESRRRAFGRTGHGSMLPGVAWRTPKPISRALRLLVPIILRRELDPAMNATRTALGLRSERDSMLRLLTSDHGHIALWDEALRPQAPGDPPGLVTCGFPFLEDAAALPAEVAEFLETDPPPIVCALGTTGGPMPLPVADLVADACELAGRRALLIGDLTADLRSDVALGRVRASHARFREGADRRPPRGDGTLAAVLRAGKPSLVLPLANDQFDNGVRLKGRGVAAILDVRRATPARARRVSCASFSTIVLPRVRRLAWAHACALRTARGVPPTP